jgi:hypothetical protein
MNKAFWAQLHELAELPADPTIRVATAYRLSQILNTNLYYTLGKK